MSLWKYAAAAVFVFSSVALFSASAFAQGIIIPRPCDRPARCPRPLPPPHPLPLSLPVKSITIDVRIKGRVARTHVEQVFENRTGLTLEGTYFFPVPEGASVVSFAIWENGRKISGEVMTRDEARKIYDRIVRTLRDPGLLEYSGRNLLQASVFPIPPRSDKKIELAYSELLPFDSGTMAYDYPLGTGRAVWDPRIRGGAGPAAQEFGTVAGKVEIEGDTPVRNVYSPSHVIDRKSGGGKSVVTFETKGDASDFKLFYSLSADPFGVSLIAHREPGKDGYYMLLVSPDSGSGADELVEKDVVFVLDTSGSMADDGKLEKARPALKFGIRSLNKGDRFGLVSFAGEDRLFDDRLRNAEDPGKREAESFIDKLAASGGTNIDDALKRAVGLFDNSSRPKIIVLLTDGLPTVGERDIDKITGNVRNAGVKGLRLFPFGVGYDVNTKLLDTLGSENSGYSGYIEPKEDLEIKVSSFFQKVNSPVLSDISIDLSPVRSLMNHPDKLTDIFRGVQAVMIGRYSNEADVANAVLRLNGSVNGKPKRFRFSGLAFPLRSSANDFLPRLWASRRVGWLIEQIRLNGESKELKDELTDLGTRYGLVTPYTSYLAADGSFATRETEGNRFAVTADAPSPLAAMRAESGRDAVKSSVQQNALRDNLYVRQAGPDAGRSVFLSDSPVNLFVGRKNFLKDGVAWVDSEYDKDAALSVVDLKFWSEEYFALASRDAELGRYLALGRNVTIVWKGQVYRIRE